MKPPWPYGPSVMKVKTENLYKRCTFIVLSFSKGNKALKTLLYDPSSQSGSVVRSMAMIVLTTYYKKAKVNKLCIHAEIKIQSFVGPIVVRL